MPKPQLFILAMIINYGDIDVQRKIVSILLSAFAITISSVLLVVILTHHMLYSQTVNYDKKNSFKHSSIVSSYLGIASNNYDSANYTEAIKYYDKVLAIDPNYKTALKGKGNALMANDTRSYRML